MQTRSIALLAILVAVSGAAHADGVATIRVTGIPGQGNWETTLHARDLDRNGVADAVFDSDLNITWLLEPSDSTGYGWVSANAWATTLVFAGHTGWRLPTMVDTGAPGCDQAYSGTDCGHNVQTRSGGVVYSEFANLFYNTYGNKALYDSSGNFLMEQWQARLPNMFWLNVENAANPEEAWFFNPIWGDQATSRKDNFGGHNFLATAVHDGDIGAPVPEPSTWAMLIAGLAGAMVAGRTTRVRLIRPAPN